MCVGRLLMCAQRCVYVYVCLFVCVANIMFVFKSLPATCSIPFRSINHAPPAF